MRIKQLTYKGTIHVVPSAIKDLLIKHGLNWLNQAEIDNAILEIKEDKLYWIGGTWHYGVWKDGVWKDGVWMSGTWEDGVWRNGIWKKGTWKKGIWMNGIWEDGTFESGEFRKGTKKKGNFNISENVKKFCEYFKK